MDTLNASLNSMDCNIPTYPAIIRATISSNPVMVLAARVSQSLVAKEYMCMDKQKTCDL